MSRRQLYQYAMKDPFADIPIVLIKGRDILDIRERLLKKTGGEKINTINKVIDSVKTVLSEAYLREDIDRNPGLCIGKLQYNKKEPGILSPESLLELLSEKTLQYSAAAGDLIFCHGTGKPLGPTWWRKNFYRVLESMGYVKREVSSEKDDLTPNGKKRKRKVCKYISETGEPLTPHSLRHSLNTNLLGADGNVLKIQAHLGWTSNSLIPLLTRVQQGHTHLRVENLREIAELVD